ncbi:MAG: hypothetical protein ABI395_10505, partial [Sphingobium sp.]
MLDLAWQGGESRADGATEKREGRGHHDRQRPAISTKAAVEHVAEHAPAKPTERSVQQRPGGAAIAALNDADGEDARENCCGKPKMVTMDGEPSPPLLEPRLKGVAMRPMLADEIGKIKAIVGRNEAAHQRPARPD